MTDRSILEDTIATALRRVDEIRAAHRALPEDTSVEEIASVHSGFPAARDALEDAVREWLRAAGVVPAEPAIHDTLATAARNLPREPPFGAYLRYMRNGNTRDAETLSEWDAKWKALRVAMAAVDGEAPAT